MGIYSLRGAHLLNRRIHFCVSDLFASLISHHIVSSHLVSIAFHSQPLQCNQMDFPESENITHRLGERWRTIVLSLFGV